MWRLLLLTFLGSLVAVGSACSDDCEQQAGCDVCDAVGDVGDAADDAVDNTDGDTELVPEAYRDYIESDGFGGFLVRASGITPADGSDGELPLQTDQQEDEHPDEDPG